MKTWELRRSWGEIGSEESWEVVVMLDAPWYWRLLYEVTTFLTHHVACWVPRLPLPIVHWGETWCDESPSLHVHNPYTWFGWNYESELCMGVESMIRELHGHQRQEIFRVGVDKVEAEIVARADGWIDNLQQ